MDVTYPPPVVPASALPELLRQPWVPNAERPDTLTVVFRGRQIDLICVDVLADCHPQVAEAVATHVAKLHAAWLAGQEGATHG